MKNFSLYVGLPGCEKPISPVLSYPDKPGNGVARKVRQRETVTSSHFFRLQPCRNGGDSRLALCSMSMAPPVTLATALFWDAEVQPAAFFGTVCVNNVAEEANAAPLLQRQRNPIDVSNRAPATMLTSPSGEHLMAWLKGGSVFHQQTINDAKVLVHIINGTVYQVRPGMFQRNVQEHPQITAG